MTIPLPHDDRTWCAEPVRHDPGDPHVIRLCGHLGAPAIGDLRRKIAEVARDCETVVIEMEDVDGVEHHALGPLMALLRSTASRRSVVLRHPSPSVARTLHVLGAGRLFAIEWAPGAVGRDVPPSTQIASVVLPRAVPEALEPEAELALFGWARRRLRQAFVRRRAAALGRSVIDLRPQASLPPSGAEEPRIPDLPMPDDPVPPAVAVRARQLGHPSAARPRG